MVLPSRSRARRVLRTQNPVPSLVLFGMTTSTFSASALPALQPNARQISLARPAAPTKVTRRHTFASRMAFVTICTAIVLTTLAYGTVHYWAMGAFTLSAAVLVVFWCVDGLTLRSVQLNRNGLQLPLLAFI